jgi:hypothetical protein
MSHHRARIAALREVFAALVVTPDQARIGDLKDAGELMDEGYLDGAQYGAVYDLIEALQQPDSPRVRELAQRCLDIIF